MMMRLAISLEGAQDQRPHSPSAPVGCNEGDAQPEAGEGELNRLG